MKTTNKNRLPVQEAAENRTGVSPETPRSAFNQAQAGTRRKPERDGGPAFPLMAAWQRGGQIELECTGAGMSVLTCTAAKLMAAMVANPEFHAAREPGEETPEAYARRAFDYAEAFLREDTRRRERLAALDETTPHENHQS